MKKIISIAFIAFLIDRIIKCILINVGSFTIIKNFFAITILKNTGAAFSILRNNTVFLIMIGLIALFLIYWFLIRNKTLKTIEIWVYELLIGGIIGNLTDRIIYGYVIDYLDFNIFGFNAPVFNFADICIVAGVFIMLISVLKGDQDETRNK